MSIELIYDLSWRFCFWNVLLFLWTLCWFTCGMMLIACIFVKLLMCSSWTIVGWNSWMGNIVKWYLDLNRKLQKLELGGNLVPSLIPFLELQQHNISSWGSWGLVAWYLKESSQVKKIIFVIFHKLINCVCAHACYHCYVLRTWRQWKWKMLYINSLCCSITRQFAIDDFKVWSSMISR